jgi:hypothetical protein
MTENKRDQGMKKVREQKTSKSWSRVFLEKLMVA